MTELSPGRSPGLASAIEKSVGTTEKVIGSGILNRGTFLDGSALRIASRLLPVVPTGLFVLRISTQDCVLG
jgi:hypothetical protein